MLRFACLRPILKAFRVGQSANLKRKLKEQTKSALPHSFKISGKKRKRLVTLKAIISKIISSFGIASNLINGKFVCLHNLRSPARSSRIVSACSDYSDCSFRLFIQSDCTVFAVDRRTAKTVIII